MLNVPGPSQRSSPGNPLEGLSPSEQALTIRLKLSALSTVITDLVVGLSCYEAANPQGSVVAAHVARCRAIRGACQAQHEEIRRLTEEFGQ